MSANEEKEKVLIFDDGSLESVLVQQMEPFSTDYDFEKIKVDEFEKGDLTNWFDKIKDKGSAEQRQKVFLTFSSEDTIANDIRKELYKLQSKYPNLSIAMVFEGMHKDAVKEKLNIRPDRTILRDIRRQISTGELKDIKPDDNEAIQAEVEKQRQADIDKAFGKKGTSPSPPPEEPPV